MHILEKLNDQRQITNTDANCQNATPPVKVAIVDGMAEVQSLDKPDWIKNCAQLAENFCNRIFQKYSGSDEVRLIFDRYALPLSLKSATRVRRQGGQDPVYYRISDSTHIAKVPLKRLLSHTKTKIELPPILHRRLKCILDRVASDLWWHGEASVNQRTKTWGISKVTRKKRIRRLSCMPSTLLLTVLLNCAFTHQTQMS